MILGTFNGANVIAVPSLGYSDVQLQMNDAVSVNRAPWTNQANIYPWQAQWWSGVITLPAMNRASAAMWQAFLGELQGQTNVFSVGNALEALPQGSVPPAQAVTVASAGQSGSSLAVTGLPVSATGLLLPGDNIQIGYRLYKVLEAVASDSSGNAAISIFPYLRDEPAAGTPVILQNCQGLFRLSNNQRGWSYSPHAGWGIDPLHIIEAI